jgi:WD40 repeat protein
MERLDGRSRTYPRRPFSRYIRSYLVPRQPHPRIWQRRQEHPTLGHAKRARTSDPSPGPPQLRLQPMFQSQRQHARIRLLRRSRLPLGRPRGPRHALPTRPLRPRIIRDGTLIVSCSHDGLIRVWDTATGQCLRTIVHEDNAPVTCVRFSPNGKYILAWTLDSCIRLWNYIEGKGKCVKTYQGHTNKKYSLSGAFGTYGSQKAEHRFAFIASGSEEGNVLLWDVSSKNLLQKLEGHSDTVLSVDTHPSEPLIASAGLDRVVRLWRAVDMPDEEGVNGAVGESEREKLNGVKAETEVDGANARDPTTLPPNPFAEAMDTP